jgi:single-strand DNA-binding protein
MSGSVNKVILIGNVGKDPEIKKPIEGSAIATLSIATSEYWKDKATGVRKDKTEWHRIVVFNDKLVNVIEKYVQKGSRIYVEGAIQTRKWTDTNGIERYTTEVCISKFKGELVLLSKNNDEENSSILSSDRSSGGLPLPSNFDDINDNIPF